MCVGESTNVGTVELVNEYLDVLCVLVNGHMEVLCVLLNGHTEVIWCW